LITIFSFSEFRLPTECRDTLPQGSVAAAVAAAEARSLGSGGTTALSALSALAETPTFEIAGVSVADPAAGLTAAADELVYLLPAIGEIAKIVPRDTLAHRLSVISEVCFVFSHISS
jgi:hypothetical protein